MSSRLCPFCMRMSEVEICPHCGKHINYAGSPAHLPAGYVVSGKHPYVLGAAIGQGGFGITYIALDMVTSVRVAIKEYYPTYCSTRTDGATVTAYSNQEEVYTKGKERFLDEARTLKSLSDLPNIVNVLDFFEANNTAYLVMEFLDGSSLKEHAAKHGKFPAQKFLQQIKPLMEDIHRMHERGVIHRDIAPDNIILLPDGQMKLIDFGAARSYVGDKSMTVVVKKGFAPVEQYMSKGSTSSTDVYALAATIYYCTTGVVPPDSAERQYDNVPLKPISELGADITRSQEQAIFKALEVLQKDRTQSIHDFLDALQETPKPSKNLLEGDSHSSNSSTGNSGSRKKTPVILVAVASVLILVCAFFLFSGKNSDTSRPEDQKSSLQETESTHQTVLPTTPASESPADRVAEPVQLTVLAAQYGSNTADWWSDFANDFEQQYPNVNLVVDVASWNDIYTIVNTRIANGEAPDILNIDVFADYQAEGLLLPVQKYMSDETYAKFFPQFLEHSSIGGKVWAVPDLTSARALYYNKQIFEEVGLEVPSTWAELQNACEVIKKQYPKISPLGLDMTTEDGSSTFACFALSAGGGFTDSNGNWKLNSDENVETVDFLTGLVLSGLTNADPMNDTRWTLQDLFIEGNAAMILSTDNFSYSCKSAGISYGVAPIPARDGSQSSTLAVMDRMMCFDNHYTESELAAITCFFDFFYDDERYTEWTSMEDFLPATSTGCKLLATTEPDRAVWLDILTSSTFVPAEKSNWLDAKMGIIGVLQETLLGGNPTHLLYSLQEELTS